MFPRKHLQKLSTALAMPVLPVKKIATVTPQIPYDFEFDTSRSALGCTIFCKRFNSLLTAGLSTFRLQPCLCNSQSGADCRCNVGWG